MLLRELTDQLVGECNRGFRDEHHWKGWLNKHRQDIRSLPPRMRSEVLFAYGQATIPAFSGVRR